MRIRTIKPEFWSHPIIGRLPGDVQAVAIGLLNMADDEGYLLADAANVRSALRPFDDDSTNVRRALDELSRVGWLEVREHSSHGRIGRIPNFTAHQRIDRANDSKLKRYYDVAFDDDSTNVRRALDDETAEEGKGREQGAGKGKEPASAKKTRAPKEPDAFAERLNAIFASATGGAKYAPQVADWVQLAALKKASTPDDIATRWERGLRNRTSGTYPGVSTWAQLASKWNDLAVNGKGAPAERAPICEVIS